MDFKILTGPLAPQGEGNPFLEQKETGGTWRHFPRTTSFWRIDIPTIDAPLASNEMFADISQLQTENFPGPHSLDSGKTKNQALIGSTFNARRISPPKAPSFREAPRTPAPTSPTWGS